jgi:hypothetical protein
MGASQSVVSTEDFKNYLYGTAVLMLAPRLDAEIQFKECSKITDEDHHVLPMVLEQQQPSDLDGVIQAYCHYYGNSGKENAIDKYVQEHILDSEEHVQAFMKQLVSLLQERRNHVDAGIRRLGGAHESAPSHYSVPASVVRRQVHAPDSLRSSRRTQPIQAPVQVPVQAVQAPVQEHSIRSEAHRIRGHGRLQRRLKTVDDAIIIQEQAAAYQSQHQRENSIAQNMELSYQPPDGEDIQNLEYLVNGNDAYGDNVPDVYDEEISTAEDDADADAEVNDPLQQ